MLNSKAFEIRDRLTYIPVICIDMNPNQDGISEAESYHLTRTGYAERAVILFRMDGQGVATWDAYEHRESGRTLKEAHLFIDRHWDKLKSGDVIDIEFILGESDKPKISQRLK